MFTVCLYGTSFYVYFTTISCWRKDRNDIELKSNKVTLFYFYRKNRITRLRFLKKKITVAQYNIILIKSLVNNIQWVNE